VVVLSFEAGMVKPDPRIFESAAHGMGLRTDDCVMVGDSPTADGGAVHAGMSALLVPVVDDRPLLAVATRLLARR
jgi:HAD superfamily hydrolase (TIGR01509 family)